VSKKVYVALSTDFVRRGHLNVISEARKLGEVIIGVLMDSAIATYKRFPLLTFEERMLVAENIRGVKKVVPQETVDYLPNLRKYRPDFVVHGDDWREGIQKGVRESVIKTLSEWGGKLIEVPYTYDVPSAELQQRMREVGTTPQIRMRLLRRMLTAKPVVRLMEAHSGLTGLIVERTRVEQDGRLRDFDGVWVSSLTDSLSKGMPDIEYVDLTSRLNTIHQILEATTKPIVVDGDTGGQCEHFRFMVKTLERLGVSAVIIEDKVGLKRNSLLGTDVNQLQADIGEFAHKITEGKKAQVTGDFMIIARIESLILQKGLKDAIERARAYIEAGADGIMIHSRERDPSEILEFCGGYSKLEGRVPLVVVPTTYSCVTETELGDAGVGMVIYANQLLRSAYPSMIKAAEAILRNERCLEAEEFCMPVKEMLGLLPSGDR